MKLKQLLIALAGAVGLTTAAHAYWPTDFGAYGHLDFTGQMIEKPIANQNLVYNGTLQSGVNGGAHYSLAGDKQTNAGDYTATATLEAGYAWSDGSQTAASINWSIAKASIEKPIGATLAYTGAAQTGVAAGEGYTLSGTYQATDVGTYTATATPDGNHKWNDGATSAIQIQWSITENVQQEIKKVIDALNNPKPPIEVIDNNGTNVVRMTGDMTGPLVLPDNIGNVVIDLNGHNIVGANGTNGTATVSGTDGQPAIRVVDNGDGDVTQLTVVDGKSDAGVDLQGGNGGNGHPAGNGGAGIEVAPDADSDVTVNVGPNVEVAGGKGGNGMGNDDGNGNGGNGGAGVEGDVGTNNGTISGGNGGNGAAGDPAGGNGGNGGAGVSGEGPTSGNPPIQGNGGAGGDGPLPGAGGEPNGQGGHPTAPGGYDPIPWQNMGTNEAGVAVFALTNSVVAPLVIPDNLGPIVLDLNGHGLVASNGVDGVNGGRGTDGGSAVVISPAEGDGKGATQLEIKDSTVTDPTKRTEVAGGRGGNGNPPGGGGLAIDTTGAREGVSCVGDNQTVDIRDGEGGQTSDPLIQELKAAFKGGADVASETDGEGHTTYKVTVTNAVEGPVDIPAGVANIVVDLNGQTITGANGTAGDGDGKPAITVGPDTELTLSGQGTVKGGDGADGNPAGAGGAGVQVAEGGKVNVGEHVKVIGGKGGNGTGENANGGNGGAGVDGDVGTNEGSITGGKGGDGAQPGGFSGEGGEGVSGDKGTGGGSITSGEDGQGLLSSDRIKKVLDFNSEDLGNSNVVFETSGEYAWIVDRDPKHAIAGGSSMCSGNDMQSDTTSVLTMTTPHGGTLTFNWGVLSQQYLPDWGGRAWGGRLVVNVNSSPKAETYETLTDYPESYQWTFDFVRDGTNAVVKLPRGASTVEWSFKNAAIDPRIGHSQGWVDNVRLAGADAGVTDDDLSQAINAEETEPEKKLHFVNDPVLKWSVDGDAGTDGETSACTPELLGPNAKTVITTAFTNAATVLFDTRVVGTGATMRCYASQTFLAGDSHGRSFWRTVTNLLWQTGPTPVTTSGDREDGFKTMSVLVNGSGVHELFFEFENNDAGDGIGWLDNLLLRQDARDPEGGNAADGAFKDGNLPDVNGPNRPQNLDWKTGGIGVWFSQAVVVYEGDKAMQSGSVKNLEGSEWLSAEFTGRGQLSWAWMTDCAMMSPIDQGFTGALVRFDDEGNGTKGESKIFGGLGKRTGWQTHNITMGPGHHKAVFTYAKNMVPTNDTTADAAWVDSVLWCPDRVWNRLEELFPSEEATVTNDTRTGIATVTLLKDVGAKKIDDDLGDVVIDLRGYSIKGDDGTQPDSPDGKPAITIVPSECDAFDGPTRLILKGGTSENAAEIKGGNGADGNGDHEPGKGGAGILVDGGANPDVAVTAEKDVNVVGGDGGKGVGDQTGGEGGAGVDGGKVDGNQGTIIGGNGGDSEKGIGGAGGAGVDGGDVSGNTEAGTITGGNGGSSTQGTGGEGGAGVDGGKVDGNQGTITGGNGGNGGTGENGTGHDGGAGGKGVDGGNVTENTGTINGGNGGNGGAGTGSGNGGNGGNGGDGDKPGNGGNGGNTDTGKPGDGGKGGKTTDPNGKDGKEGEKGTQNGPTVIEADPLMVTAIDVTPTNVVLTVRVPAEAVHGAGNKTWKDVDTFKMWATSNGSLAVKAAEQLPDLKGTAWQDAQECTNVFVPTGALDAPSANGTAVLTVTRTAEEKSRFYQVGVQK